MPPVRDSPLEFTRAERAFALALLLCGVVGLTSPYWLPAALGPGEPLAALDPAERAALERELADWTTRSEALADSLSAARAARDSTYAARRNYYAERDRRWAANRERWARERAERAAASADRQARRAERNARYAVDLSIPLPPVGSVDPNRADSATLRRLGIPHYVVSRLLKYRAKAGGFRTSDDVAKLYGLEDTTYARLRAYLVDGPLERLPRAGEADRPRTVLTSERTAASGADLPRLTEAPPPPLVDVNDASEADLTAVRGIGPFYAKQILDYRDRLGGFLSVEQVAETPKLREGAFAQWADQLTVAPAARPTTPLRINQLDARALARHPYLPYSKAATLVAYRQHHGAFGVVGDLYDVVALDSALIARLAPYLDFGQ